MLTNSFTPASSAGGAGLDALSSRAPSTENADMFTKLLVAQIRNQDPLEPSDPGQFVNQLSQLSQTEALQNLAKLNSANASVLESLQVLALGAQVGADLMVAAAAIRLDGSAVNGAVTLASPSAATTLVLTGADGQQHTLALGSHGAGALPFTIDPGALGLEPGNYSLQVQTSYGQESALEVAGRLDSVRMSAAGIILKVAGIGDVAPSSVTAFNGKSSSTLAAATPSSAH